MTAPAPEISGTCDEKFEAVREAFLGNFLERDELGASLALMVDGEIVADLWAGWADAERTREWQRDTIVNVYSTTKGIVAVAGAILADRGALDYDAPVTQYWPEFGRNGKHDMPLGYLFSHQAGLPTLDADLAEGSIYDWGTMVKALADQVPIWDPGSAQGYHAFTYGWLVGEPIRRITGKSLGAYVAEEISDPLAVDFFIGTPASEDPRIADIIPLPRSPMEPDSLLAKTMLGADLTGAVNTRRWREAELPAANGHGNARALATIYGAMSRGGECGGVRLLSSEGVERSAAEQVRSVDRVMGFETRRAMGFILNTPGGRYHWGPNLRTFGHSGAGGSLGFADPDARIGFGYAMNRMSGGLDADPRWPSMIDAVYGSL